MSEPKGGFKEKARYAAVRDKAVQTPKQDNARYGQTRDRDADIPVSAEEHPYIPPSADAVYEPLGGFKEKARYAAARDKAAQFPEQANARYGQTRDMPADTHVRDVTARDRELARSDAKRKAKSRTRETEQQKRETERREAPSETAGQRTRTEQDEPPTPPGGFRERSRYMAFKEKKVTRRTKTAIRTAAAGVERLAATGAASSTDTFSARGKDNARAPENIAVDEISTAGRKAAKTGYRAAKASARQLGRRLAQTRAARSAKSAGKELAAKAKESVKKVAKSAVSAAAPAAAGLAVAIIPVLLLISAAAVLLSSGSQSGAYTPVSPEVEAYTPIIQLYAGRYGIPEYVELIKAVMMQESGGRGNDPMQSASSGYNPEHIMDPEHSIDAGVHYLADALASAGVDSPIDLENISLALQGYNYGLGYISWAKNNYGGYSSLNAVEFSEMMIERYGLSGYGDRQYVPHVLRYYPYGRIFMGGSGQAMVDVALSQIGNQGGLKFCYWYGLSYRVEWCAIFVSWCADQCGYMDDIVLYKEAGVRPFISWFKDRGLWQDNSYEPRPGDIIFFDWEGDYLGDHVGIVEKVEAGWVYTVEGNSGDRVAQRRYFKGSRPILGYGTPLY